MRAIQLFIDDQAVADLDAEARRQGTNRSVLIRAAIDAFLATTRREALEEAHRRAYERDPLVAAELSDWEGIQAWPEE